MSRRTCWTPSSGGRPWVSPSGCSPGEELLGEAVTDVDGRARLAEGATAAGTHRLVFTTGPWFTEQGRETFYPEVVLTFAVLEPADHHHVPLLLSPFAYSTYRGS